MLRHRIYRDRGEGIVKTTGAADTGARFVALGSAFNTSFWYRKARAPLSASIRSRCPASLGRRFL